MSKRNSIRKFTIAALENIIHTFIIQDGTRKAEYTWKWFADGLDGMTIEWKRYNETLTQFVPRFLIEEIVRGIITDEGKQVLFIHWYDSGFEAVRSIQTNGKKHAILYAVIY